MINHQVVLRSNKIQSRILLISIVGAFLTGLILSLLGVLLIYVNAEGGTEIYIYKFSFKSSNVGIAAMFVGALIIVCIVPTALKIHAGVGNDDKNGKYHQNLCGNHDLIRKIDRIMQDVSKQRSDDDGKEHEL